MEAHERLLKDIRAFCKATGIGPTQFGIDACGRRDLVTRLSKGRGVNLSTYAQVTDFMARYSKKKRVRNRDETAVSA